MLLGGGRGGNRIGAVVALVAVLAMVVVSPAGAAGAAKWGEERDWAGGVYQHVLAWLGLAPSPASNPGVVLKCDLGSQTDPNGACLPKSRRQGPRTGPNGHP
jgi:hypothetical protein